MHLEPPRAAWPPAVPPTAGPVLAAGAVYASPDSWPHAALGYTPISFVATDLWHALTALAIAPTATEATGAALLRAIATEAVDAALAPGNEGAPRGDLWVSAPAYIAGSRRVIWFQRSRPGGPVTAYFAPEPDPAARG